MDINNANAQRAAIQQKVDKARPEQETIAVKVLMLRWLLAELAEAQSQIEALTAELTEARQANADWLRDITEEIAERQRLEAGRADGRVALIRAYDLAQDHWSAQCFCFTSAPEALRRKAQDTAREGFNEIVGVLGPIVRPLLREEYVEAERQAKAEAHPSAPGEAGEAGEEK